MKRQQERAEAAESPGNLALVPFPSSENALAIRSDNFADSLAVVKAQVSAHRYVKKQDLEHKAQAVFNGVESVGTQQCSDTAVTQ